MDADNKIREIEERLQSIDNERTLLLRALHEASATKLPSASALELDRRTYPQTAEARIQLFGALFAARRDLYPRFWENLTTGRKGYSPACKPVYENGRRLKPTEVYARSDCAVRPEGTP